MSDIAPAIAELTDVSARARSLGIGLARYDVGHVEALLRHTAEQNRLIQRGAPLPVLRPDVLARIRDSIEAHVEMAETTEEVATARDLEMLLQWYEAARR